VEDTRWLTDEELEAWTVLIAVTMKLPARLDRQLRRDAGISHFEYGILSALSEAPDRTLRMSELAGMSNGTLSRLSHAVTRLESRRWGRRAPCPDDGRLTEATLTDEGWRKVLATSPGHVAEARRLVVDALSPGELAGLAAIGRRVLDRVDPGGAWPPARPSD